MKDNVSKMLAVTGALSLGALLMYYLDPEQGRRRRALAGDKVKSAGKEMSHMADVAARDATNRGRGLAARMRSGLRRDDVDDATLAQRVRSRIGRCVSNPGAIDVSVHDGTVQLSGPILKTEMKSLMSAVWSTRGVQNVECRFDIHEQPGNIPALQSGQKTILQSGRWMNENWTPGMRAAAGAAGAVAAVAGLIYRPIGLVGTMLGGALLARSVSNKSLQQLAGMSETGSVHIVKEMFIAVSPERVFDFWRRQENFPQFMRNVQEIRPVSEGRWHWRVAGPMGRSVEWEARITEEEVNRRLAWETDPGSPVRHTGEVDFEPEGAGTRLRVVMDYTPVGGVIGHSLARLFGKDAKSEMDEDLMRVKSYLETGIAPHDTSQQAKSTYPHEPRSIH